MFYVCAMALVVGQMNALTIREEETLRDYIYNKKPEIGGAQGIGLISAIFIKVPKEVESLYDKKPGAAINVIVKIVEGANPEESRLAAAYAVTLMEKHGFGGYIIYSDLFGNSEYEKLKQNDNVTWRMHLVRLVKFKASKKKIDLTIRDPEK